MGAQKIILPADSTGKAIWTQERTVTGPGTVQVQYVIPASERVVSGSYLAHTGRHPLTTAAGSATTATGAFWWFYNPVGSGVLVAFRHIDVMMTFSVAATAVAAIITPRIILQGFTYTGTASGASVTPKKVDTSYAAATAVIRTNSTGMTVTATEAVRAFVPPWSQSASSGGPVASTSADWVPPDDLQPVLRAGEGIVCYQPDAGSTSEPRLLVTNFAWSEYTVP